MMLHEIVDEDIPLIYKLLKRAMDKGTHIMFYDYGRELCYVTGVELKYDDLNRTDVMWIDLKNATTGDSDHSKGYHIPMHMDQLTLRPQKNGDLELADLEQEDHDRSMGRIE